MREDGWYWVRKDEYADGGSPWLVARWNEFNEYWMKDGWDCDEAENDSYWDEIDERRIVREDE